MAAEKKIDEKGPATQALAAPPAAKDVLTTYYVGLTESCPLDFITVPTVAHEGAPAFCKWTQKATDRGDGIATLTQREHGGFIKLFPDEVEAIRTYIKTHGIHWISKVPGEIRVAIVKLSGEDTFKRSRREDISGSIDPLGKFMYMTKSKAISAEDREESNLPPTMLQEEEATLSSR
jgi:hypothetical protein